jgi:hypothetical protein
MVGLLVGAVCGVAIGTGIAGVVVGGIVAAIANATRHEPDLVVHASHAVPEMIRNASEEFQKMLEDFHRHPPQSAGVPPAAGFGPLTSEQRFRLISKHLEDLRLVAGVATKH